MIDEKPLTEEIAAVLTISLDGRESVTGGDGHVLIAVGNADFEQNLSRLLQQVSLIVNETFPNQPEDVPLVFRDRAEKHQQQFRLWNLDI